MINLTANLNRIKYAPFKAMRILKHAPHNLIQFFHGAFTHTLSFVFLLVMYLLTSLCTSLLMNKFLPLPWGIKNSVVQQINMFYQRIVKMNHLNEDSINRTNLIQLALYNMRFKKSRTFITVGGMAIGIAAIVYLVSIGYGLQELVISRVARLEEMKQANISPPVGGRAKINDETLNKISEITDVEKVMPQIAAVGRVNYNNSVSDVVVYGVTADYLIHSAIKPTQGTIFSNNDLSSVQVFYPEVAGVQTTASDDPVAIGDRISPVQFAINEGEWIRIREKPTRNAKIIGYTRRFEDVQSGEEIWGSQYNNNTRPTAESADGVELHRWIKGNVRIWQQASCEKNNPDCEDGKFVVMRDETGFQKSLEGYMAVLNMQVQSISDTPNVLGVETVGEQESFIEVQKPDPQVLQSTDGEANNGAAEEFVELTEEGSAPQVEDTKKVELPSTAVREVVVNKSTLQLLGIDENQAINQTFTLSFIVVGELLENADQKVESVPTEYKIVGVVPDDRTPILYVPFIDVRSIGVVNFSQAKVLTNKQESLTRIRTQVEALGFTTQSVSDTVAQINSLFTTARTVLFLVGMAALAVASLGMFNTLTVSLLERTREVGLMKAMGMRSSEVHELFLTESMIMGLFGGLAGLFLGVVAGQATSVLLSAYAISRGVGYLNISYTPPVFIIVILSLAMTVGLITGLYPARHATRISALNALRYE